MPTPDPAPDEVVVRIEATPLREALQPEHIAVYGQRATGAKYLINPNQDLAD